MKKLAVILCLVLLLTLAGESCALADTKCPDHPWAETKERTARSGWEPYSVVQHRKTENNYYCSYCGNLAYSTYEFAQHQLNKAGYCSICGYSRLPNEELETRAWSFYRDITQRNGFVLYESPIYETPTGKNSYMKVDQFEEYRIIGVNEEMGKLWLQIAENLKTDAIGWIPADIMYVEDGTIIPVDDAYIGHICRITVSSGRARIRPAQDPVIEYVGLDEKYTILDVAEGSDGKTWFKIMVDGNECWISSGIASIE